MSLASSQSQLLRGVAGANALGAKTETHGRRVSTLVRAGKAHDAKEHVPSKTDAPELEDSMAKKVMSGVAAASIIANVAIAPVALAAGAIEEFYGQSDAAKFAPDGAVALSGPVLSEIADLSAEDLYAQRKAKDDAAAAKKKAAAPAAKKATAAPAKKGATGPAKEGLTLQAGDVSAYDQLAGTPPPNVEEFKKSKPKPRAEKPAPKPKPAPAPKPSGPDFSKMDDPWGKRTVAATHDNSR